ncbi:hypothetical protein apy_00910 [Aeropyrum pernix]|uniref:Uncharacterized protein n=1 Tax=Aeropyrum pernix TaxID=56636 RepID=A0A401H7D1_AERPX|nr:hypothetical protein [Aeropyrum pernix]GBF08366.1 hypothetical protein apy_00910 [Aeropyrum pernix]
MKDDIRIGKEKITDILKQLEEQSLDIAAEIIAEDLQRINLKIFVRQLLECCSVECIAKAIVEAEENKAS